MVSTKEKINEKMKNSGVPWIGEIPFNWYVTKFKYLVNLYTGNSISDNEKSKYEDMINAKPYISSKDINKIYSTVDYDNGLYIKNDDDSFEVAHEGDTLMCIEGGSAGIKKALLKHDVCFVNKLCCFSAKNRLLNDKYLYYFIFSPSYENYFLSKISGLIGGVSVNELKTFNICCPAIDEQGKIADFLDIKCQKIDDTIEKINKQIEILKKYKQSLITEVVTKGLDKNAPMKDSGIEWIGKIPKNWGRNKIKYLFNNGKGLPITKDDLVEEGVPVLSYGQIHAKTNNGVNITQDLIRYVDGYFEENYPNCEVFKNDFIFADTSEDYDGCGNSCYKRDNTKLFAGYHTIILHSKSDNDNRYYAYLFKTDCWRKQIREVATGVKLFSIAQHTIMNSTIIEPSELERIKISNFLDEKCAKIDTILDKKSKQIETLERYKKSLIYEYVTGKKRV